MDCRCQRMVSILARAHAILFAGPANSHQERIDQPRHLDRWTRVKRHSRDDDRRGWKEADPYISLDARCEALCHTSATITTSSSKRILRLAGTRLRNLRYMT